MKDKTEKRQALPLRVLVFGSWLIWGPKPQVILPQRPHTGQANVLWQLGVKSRPDYIDLESRHLQVHHKAAAFTHTTVIDKALPLMGLQCSPECRTHCISLHVSNSTWYQERDHGQSHSGSISCQYQFLKMLF